VRRRRLFGVDVKGRGGGRRGRRGGFRLHHSGRRRFDNDVPLHDDSAPDGDLGDTR